jgi:hypothetical protein
VATESNTMGDMISYSLVEVYLFSEVMSVKLLPQIQPPGAVTQQFH